MNTLEYLLASVSICSFGLAVWSFVRTEVKKAKEQANIEIMREKLKSVHQSLASVFNTADAIIQIPKKSEKVDVRELQDLARLIRAQVLFLASKIKQSRQSLAEWKFGITIASDPLDDFHKSDVDALKDDVS
jgi:hypothetical protein